jgi:hypothetical protein
MNFLALIQRLGWATRSPAAASAASPPPAHDASEEAWGCGWFDSSHDLQHGLCVREHADANSLGQELPLPQWLDLHLAGWRTAPGV